MEYRKARSLIDESRRFGGEIGLGPVSELLGLLGNPQDELLFVHIAGTNGKGSVGAFLDSILREAGVRTGRFVSPALYEYREQIQADGTCISEEEFGRLMDPVAQAVGRMEREGRALPSPFEMETALAMLFFREKGCELVLLECGMGGARDATNVIGTTRLSVITSISMDHMQYLGDTLEKIAAEKAGILREGVPAVTCRQRPEVYRVLRERAARLDCPLLIADADRARVIEETILGTTLVIGRLKVHIPLAGVWQKENAVLAYEAARILGDMGYPVTDGTIRRGLEKTRWDGRFTVLGENPFLIVDGAHNPDAAKKLKASIRTCFPGRKITLVMAVFQDKQYEKMVRILSGDAALMIAMETPGAERALSAADLAGVMRRYGSNVLTAESIADALRLAREHTPGDGVIVCCGSLSFIGALTALVREDAKKEIKEKQEKDRMDLLEIRDRIDGIDRQIVGLFEQRMQLCSDVAEYKIANGKEVLDRRREKEKLRTLANMESDHFMRTGVIELFKQIMATSRKLQYRIMTKHGKAEALPFEKVQMLPMFHAKVVFQGVEGAYSFTAMHSFFGETIENFNVRTWRDAMEALKNKEADYAVLPIENSTAGIVADIYDLLYEYHFSIVGEQIIHVDHALMGLKNSVLSDIKVVYSHPQALAQCQKYLSRHPEWEQREYLNTAAAAKKVREDNDMTQAAIASPYAAQCFGLQILKKHVFSSQDNATRFIIVSPRDIYTRTAGKISVCFEAAHESGSLFHILSHFIYNDLNMTKIESRPIPDRSWEYRFFVDFEGNLDDSAVQNALHGIQAEAISLRILGNY